MSTKFYLYKRSNGIYYIGYFEGARKRWKTTGVSTKAEALKVLHDFEEHLQKKPPVISFEQFISLFKQLQGHSLRESTFKRIYQPAFNVFQSVIGNKQLNQYTLKDVETFKSITSQPQ
jgi:hypothetical protein